jgi:hypothetical protein
MAVFRLVHLVLPTLLAGLASQVRLHLARMIQHQPSRLDPPLAPGARREGEMTVGSDLGAFLPLGQLATAIINRADAFGARRNSSSPPDQRAHHARSAPRLLAARSSWAARLPSSAPAPPPSGGSR